MSLKPQLVKDELGRLCMQVSFGAYTATLTLPEGFEGWEEVRKSQFIEEAVVQMTKGLHERKNAERRTIFKRAKRESDS